MEPGEGGIAHEEAADVGALTIDSVDTPGTHVIVVRSDSLANCAADSEQNAVNLGTEINNIRAALVAAGLME